MKSFNLYFFLIAALFYSCKQPNKQLSKPIAQRDKSVTPANSFSQLFFDSSAMENFISATSIPDSLANRMRSFYNFRNYEYAWFFKDGIADHTPAFLQMQNDYIGYSGDSSLYNFQLQQFTDSIHLMQRPFNTSNNNVLNIELMLTVQFFRYARRAYQGSNQLDAQELEWFIPRKKIDPVAVLDSLIKDKGKSVSRYEPVNRQYNLLKNYLLKYYAASNNGVRQKINFGKKLYKPGDSSAVVIEMKKRLLQEGDLIKNDTTAVFDIAMQNALKNFQRRYGLTEDGTAGVAVMNEMNRPVDEYIRKILVNMERIRWVPAQPSTDYLLVNIPEFRLHIYEKGNYQWSMKVVVGSVVHSTVIFSGTLKYVVFSPYWNVPQSILKNEILPGIRRNKNYLASHNMEWNGSSVRQKPGLSNSLGLVKFLFPNNYNIYLHDTPSKSLFSESKRAFSHGCIRLGEARRLAEFLLRNDKTWDSVKITKAMNTGKEQYVTLKQPVPVFIGYFTAWVDRQGKLNFRDDIYGHDKKLASHLFDTTTSK
jgi:murein L,D-transpeptidase YcbB/YkuD